MMADKDARTLSKGKLGTPTDLGGNAVRDIAGAMNGLLADSFALYFKTKNFHWHVSGPHFRDYHLMLDEQADQILAATDVIAERVRKLGGMTLRSINQAAAMTRISPNEADYVEPADMLGELMEDNKAFVAALRAVHTVCDDHGDSASASLIDSWTDEAERRVWFLYETLRPAMTSGH
jgi:starvation-inducible DNA-binding protein